MAPRPAAESPRLERPQDRPEFLAEVAGSVAHSFNNVLTLIRGRVELMLGLVEEGRLDPLQLRKGLESIRSAAFDAADLIKRLRELMQPSRALPAVAFDANEAIRDAEALLQPHLAALGEAKGAGFRVTPRLVDAPLLASGQPGALREVLLNVLLNAVEAMPAGGEVTVETGMEEPWVVIRISDTGVGMSEEVLASAFTPFFTTKGGENMGLGLSSARAVLKRLGGAISLASRPGEGTTVSLTLPRARASDPPATDRPPSLLRGLRVLVVEDEPAFAEVLVELLTQQGSRVNLASAGRPALAQLAGGRYDLVITDLGLPDLAGYEVARVAKQCRPECVVILLSGGLLPAEALSAGDRAVDRVLAKPVDLPELLRVVVELVRRRPPGVA